MHPCGTAHQELFQLKMTLKVHYKLCVCWFSSVSRVCYTIHCDMENMDIFLFESSLYLLYTVSESFNA